MFKIVQDICLEELLSKCMFCGKEQICYSDLIATTYCMECNNKLKPNPYNLFHNQLYRTSYHFSNEEGNNFYEK
jgi:hypothetical protein